MADNNGKLVGILSYVLIGIIWYFADEKVKKDAFAKFHCKQGLNLLIVSVVGHFILGLIPIIGWLLLPLFSLAIFVLWLIGIIGAASGKKSKVPIVGGFAESYLTF